MKKNHVRWVLTLSVAAVVSAGLVLAGGHECTKSATDCAASMKDKYQTMGWLGVDMEKSEKGMKTVTKVFPGSPADQAGFQVGDQLTSINGIPYNEANYDKIKAMKKEGMKIGSTVTYEVKRGMETQTLKATLVKIPEDVLAAMIQKHQKEEHQVAQK